MFFKINLEKEKKMDSEYKSFMHPLWSIFQVEFKKLSLNLLRKNVNYLMNHIGKADNHLEENCWIFFF